MRIGGGVDGLAETLNVPVIPLGFRTRKRIVQRLAVIHLQVVIRIPLNGRQRAGRRRTTQR